MLKVCHFSSVHRTNDIRVFSKECRTLAEAGYRTTLIACAGNQSSSAIEIVEIPEGGGRVGRILLRAYRVFRLAMKQEADIYHFHDPELLPYGLLIKYLTNAKVIFDSHECYPEDLLNKEWLPAFARRPVATVYRVLEDFAAKRFDLVVAATPYIRKRFEGVAKRVVTVNNYPRIEEFSHLSREGGVARDGVCYVGAISLIRGVIPFLDSLDNVPSEVKVYVAGTFANEEVRQAATGHRNWPRVDYFGQVGRDKILEIYQQSFAGIVNFLPAPNHEYSQPNKLFEYMAAGIPVVGSDFSLWKEIIEPSGCGIAVNPASPEEIGKAINRLYADQGLVNAMADSGIKAIASCYSWEHEGCGLVEAYRRV
jgi:glycosyltransferase involved in cell wall biosynthesis